MIQKPVIQLREYQEKLIAKTRASLASGHRAPILCSPCGSGKTVMFCYFAQRTMEKGKQILILAHRSELIDQISATLRSFGVFHSFITAGRYYDRARSVQVGSVFSVVRRLSHMKPPDLIIIDEAHHAIKGSTWGRILAAFPRAYRIGVTATPQRLGGESLNDMFDDLILGPTVDDLIKQNHLSAYRLFAPSGISTEGIHVRGGDFAKDELSALVDRPTITGDVIAEYRKYAHGKRAICFCVSIEHAKHVAERFLGAGYQATSIDGSLAPEIRNQVVKDFRDGKIQVLTSCDLISEGFDLPSIEVAIMLRPTQSLALWIQQSGRALRPHPGKNYAIILDHAGNVMRHGLPDEPRDWTLEGNQNGKKNKSENGPSVRVCPKCFACAFIGALQCKFCGFAFEVQPREIREVAGELQEVDPDAIRLRRNLEQRSAESLEDLYRLGVERKYRFPRRWAQHVFQSRQARKIGRVA